MVRITSIALLAGSATALVNRGTYFDKLDDAPAAVRDEIKNMTKDACKPPHASRMWVVNGCSKPLWIRRSDGYVSKLRLLKPGESFDEAMRMDQRTPLVSYIGSENKKGYDAKISEKVGSYVYSLSRKSLDLHGHIYHIMGEENQADGESVVAAAAAAACSKGDASAWAAIGQEVQGSVRCLGKDNYFAASAAAMAQGFCAKQSEFAFEEGVLKFKGEVVNFNFEQEGDSD